jgi:hypothetical protein
MDGLVAVREANPVKKVIEKIKQACRQEVLGLIGCDLVRALSFYSPFHFR